VTEVHVVVPEGIDDPDRPSGGNNYDRHLIRGLTLLGWSAHEHAVASPSALAGVVERIPDGAVVLLDGLVASAATEVLVPQAQRLRLVVLVHMSLGHSPAERAVLFAAAAVVTTSAWTRRRLIELYSLPADRVHVAEPGADPAGIATGTGGGGALLCVAAVTFVKGHDVLLDALEAVSDLSWRCDCVGSLAREPEFAGELVRRAREAGLADRVRFPGPRTGADLDRSYAAADLVVVPSRAEAYGMVVTEAVARGLPVVAAEVGGLPDTVGHGAGGVRPGLLVGPGDADALAAALRSWLGDAELRERLCRAASERRASLPAWSATASAIASVLEGVAG